MAKDLIRFEPDWGVPPGQVLADTLDNLGMSQADLAARTGLSPKHINQVIKQHAAISPQAALQLERATGVPATLWNRLEADYRVMVVRDLDRQRIDYSSWLSRFDLRTLRSRGILKSKEEAAQAEELLLFFGVADPDAFDRVWSQSFATFRRSPSFKAEPNATSVWLRIGQLLAQNSETQPYQASKLKALVPELRRATIDDPQDAVMQVVDMLAHAGVAVVLASEQPGCRASGAAWWSSQQKAVVLLSNRGKREDRLWFTLFHELGHLLLHAKRDSFIDEKGAEDSCEETAPRGVFIDDGSRDAIVEEEADRFAVEALIPPQFIPLIESISSESDVVNVANEIGISPGIVAGRYQHNTQSYNLFNKCRRPVPDELFRTSPFGDGSARRR